MSPLYLRCALCDRQQADGLLSGAAWGRFELPPGTEADHPGLNGNTLRACPECMGRHGDWHEKVATVLGLSVGTDAARRAAQ